ncbi:hypothetical protein VE00_08891 [Pseudogymnoascus sp. WSF 3629]|nr:hypothetical protein VE00_08891 [Pseudogymnoascus sp. WSF 3629]
MTVSQQRPREIIYDEESHRQRHTRESNIWTAVITVALVVAAIIFFATGYAIYRILPPMRDYSTERHLETMRELVKIVNELRAGR